MLSTSKTGNKTGPFFLENTGTRATVVESNDNERKFQIAMLKPYHCNSALMSMLLNPDYSNLTYLTNIIDDSNDSRFSDVKQKEYDGVVLKGEVKTSGNIRCPYRR